MKYNKLIDGLSDRKYCPFCHSTLIIDESISILHSIDSNSLTFREKDMTIEVDLATDTVTRFEQLLSYHSINYDSYGLSSSYVSSAMDNPIDLSVKYVRRIKSSCRCDMYAKAIATTIYIPNRLVTDVKLNFETFKFVKGESLYEVSVSYSVQRTSVRTVPVGSSLYAAPFLDLPFIPVNFQNPEETLERILTLVVFS